MASRMMQHEGALNVYGIHYRYSMTVAADKTKNGIEGGKITMLRMSVDGETVCEYDRRWIKEPDNANTELAAEILLHEYNW